MDIIIGLQRDNILFECVGQSPCHCHIGNLYLDNGYKHSYIFLVPVMSTRYTSLTVLSSKYTFPHLTVQAHILGTYISEHVKRGSAPADLHRLSPSISMNYRPWKEHLFFIRAMYKGCFRTPTFNDLYYFRSGNKDLKPEKAQEYNIGITYGGSPFTLP